MAMSRFPVSFKMGSLEIVTKAAGLKDVKQINMRKHCILCDAVGFGGVGAGGDRIWATVNKQKGSRMSPAATEWPEPPL